MHRRDTTSTLDIDDVDNAMGLDRQHFRESEICVREQERVSSRTAACDNGGEVSRRWPSGSALLQNDNIDPSLDDLFAFDGPTPSNMQLNPSSSYIPLYVPNSASIAAGLTREEVEPDRPRTAGRRELGQNRVRLISRRRIADPPSRRGLIAHPYHPVSASNSTTPDLAPTEPATLNHRDQHHRVSSSRVNRSVRQLHESATSRGTDSQAFSPAVYPIPPTSQRYVASDTSAIDTTGKNVCDTTAQQWRARQVSQPAVSRAKDRNQSPTSDNSDDDFEIMPDGWQPPDPRATPHNAARERYHLGDSETSSLSPATAFRPRYVTKDAYASSTTPHMRVEAPDSPTRSHIAEFQPPFGASIALDHSRGTASRHATSTRLSYILGEESGHFVDSFTLFSAACRPVIPRRWLSHRMESEVEAQVLSTEEGQAWTKLRLLYLGLKALQVTPE